MTYDPDPHIELTCLEVWQGAQEGSRRWIKARMLNRPTGNGRWDAKKSTIEFDWTGALAERAFTKKLGEKWAPLDRPDRYHAAHDVAGWDVKGTRCEIEPHLPLPMTADPDARYVLLSGWHAPADLPHWTIVGWGIGRDLFLKRYITTRRNGGQACYWIPTVALEEWPPRVRVPRLVTNGLRP